MSLRSGEPAPGAAGTRRTGPGDRTGAGGPGPRRAPRAGRRIAAAAALLLAGTLAVAGCSASSAGSSEEAAGPAHTAPAPPAADNRAVEQSGPGSAGASAASPGRSGAKTQLAPAYLVRTAKLSVRTPHVADALARARTLAAAAGGYAGDEDTQVDSAGHTTSTVQLRVPPAAYDSVLDDLAELGTLVSREVNVQDVTGQVVDVQSRVKSQQASVDRVRKLMAQATDLNDVVSLESELSTREAALESLEAQQASLKEQTNLATISLTLAEPPVRAVHAPRKVARDGFWTQVGHALGDGWHAFYVALRTLLVVLSAVLPFLAAALLLLVAYRLVRRRWWPRPDQDRWAARFRPSGPLPKHPQDGGADARRAPRHDASVAPVPADGPAAPPVPGQPPRQDGPQEPADG
jgi:hypothetical protein